MLIAYISLGTGWEPIGYMATLAAELFEAELLVLDHKMPNRFQQLEYLLSNRKKHSGDEACLLICPNPTCLSALSLIPNWNKRFSWIGAWIIDSFWLDWLPKSIQVAQPFDHLFITSEEDVETWQRLMKTPTTWLPWGSDVLRLGGKEPNRTWDLLRVGRQPPEWEDDSRTEQLCHEKNLRFHGRPKFFTSANQNQIKLMELYRQTKFLLAFSNIANPTNYTHPVREYLTARWVDALACGVVVAGISPKEPSIDRLLWEGATLDLPSVHLKDGLQIITEAVQAWQAEQAEENYWQALKRLDWRWRFATIADAFHHSPPRLKNELQLLAQKTERRRAEE